MILIIGAGPAGLATAYHLQRRGLAYCVLEKETVGATWLHHYDRLRLHTLKQVSGLPGLPMPRQYPNFPSAHQLRDYLTEYARHFKLRVEEGVMVRRASYAEGRWQLDTSQGEKSGEKLVVATGIWNTPICPELPGQEQFGGQVLHSNDYRNAQPFQGQRVLVVGVGNSGAEIAVDLSEHGVETSIVIRTGGSFVPYPRSATAMRIIAWLFRRLPRTMGRPLLNSARRKFDDIGIPTHPDAPLDYYPVVGFEFPEAVRAGRIQVYRSGMQAFCPHGVRFADGQEAAFDTVIMATGYRPTVDFVAHELEFNAAGFPLLQAGRSTRNPHLYCVGFFYPTTEGFLQSLDRQTRQVVQQL